MKKLFILSIAISAITLFTSCIGGTSETSEEKDFSTLISEGDFAAAHAILQAEINNCDYDLNDEFGADNREAANNIYTKADVLYKEWILDVISTDTENPEMAVAQLLMEYPILGEKKEGFQRAGYYANAFVSGTSHFNQLCNKVFTAALLSKQYDIAEVIVNAYMDDVELVQGVSLDSHPENPRINGVEVRRGDKCYVTFSQKSKTEAQKKLDEARQNI